MGAADKTGAAEAYSKSWPAKFPKGEISRKLNLKSMSRDICIENKAS